MGVWIPTGETEDGDGCIPVSESYTRATDRTSVRRRYTYFKIIQKLIIFVIVTMM